MTLDYVMVSCDNRIDNNWIGFLSKFGNWGLVNMRTGTENFNPAVATTIFLACDRIRFSNFKFTTLAG